MRSHIRRAELSLVPDFRLTQTHRIYFSHTLTLLRGHTRKGIHIEHVPICRLAQGKRADSCTRARRDVKYNGLLVKGACINTDDKEEVSYTR